MVLAALISGVAWNTFYNKVSSLELSSESRWQPVNSGSMDDYMRALSAERRYAQREADMRERRCANLGSLISLLGEAQF